MNELAETSKYTIYANYLMTHLSNNSASLYQLCKSSMVDCDSVGSGEKTLESSNKYELSPEGQLLIRCS